MSKRKESIVIPEGVTEVLLHACCAPCSSAIVEWMVNNGIRPTIFYFNPNIFPVGEYIIRKEESKRHAESLHLHWIDGDYDHQNWLHSVNGMEKEPERGKRCECCFRLRLLATAKKAHEIGISHFAQVQATDIKAVCIYTSERSDKLDVELRYSNPYITSAWVYPGVIEFMVEQ